MNGRLIFSLRVTRAFPKRPLWRSERIRHPLSIVLSPDEELVYSFTRQLNLTRVVSDDLYARTVAGLGPDATVDLVGVLGYYSLISMTINAFQVPQPDGG